MQLCPSRLNLRGWKTALLAAALCGAGAARADDAADIRLLLTRGELAAALARAESASQAQPSNVQLRFLKGVVLMDLQRNAQALELFNGMSQDFPELPEPFNNIALLQVRQGQPELARQALEAALRNDPSHRQARVNLAQVHLILAANALQLATVATPGDAALQQKLEAVRALLAVPAR
jgi:Flp pilus assembly protein TadD